MQLHYAHSIEKLAAVGAKGIAGCTVHSEHLTGIKDESKKAIQLHNQPSTVHCTVHGTKGIGEEGGALWMMALGVQSID